MFPKSILQSDRAPISWLHFLEEATKGSSMAVEIFTYAEYALVAQITGKRHHAESPSYVYSQELNGLLLRQPPFPSFEICWQIIEQDGYLPHSLIPSSTPCHPSEFYDDLWQRKEQVDGAELVHDALLQCYQQWTLRAYYDVRERVEEFTDEESCSDHYNAQDVVSAMLYLVAVWAIHNQSK
jgi:hypothetical protein